MSVNPEAGVSAKEAPYVKLLQEPDFTADPKRSPDKVLGLSYKATQEQLRRRHRELTLRYHPDATKGDDSMMVKINVARDVFMDMRPKNVDIESETGDELAGGKSLYELAATSASDEEFVMRQKYLRGEIVRQKKHLQDLTEDMLLKLGTPSEFPREWSEFYTRTQDLSQRIENLTAELEAKRPRKVLHPDTATFSPLHAEALATYEKFFGKR